MAGVEAGGAAPRDHIDALGTRRLWIRTVLRWSWRFTRTKPLGAAGGIIVLVLVITAIFAPFIATHDPYALGHGSQFRSPGFSHFFGTDNFGRDIFSRVVHGARVSVYVGVMSVAIGTIIGALTGVLSGYFGAWVDAVFQRIMDALLAFPTLVLAIAIVSVLGQSTTNVIIAIGIVAIPTSSRVIRAVTMSIVGRPFIEAAHCVGASHTRIIVWHVVPNCIAPFLILATAMLGTAILAEASLSFLGLGTPPPEPSWGAMLSGTAQRHVDTAPWMAIFPGLAISAAVFGFNLLGDALRDELDPRLRGSH